MYFIISSFEELEDLVQKHGRNIIIVFKKKFETLLLTCFNDGNKENYCNLFGCMEGCHKHRQLSGVYSYHSRFKRGENEIFAMNYIELTQTLLTHIVDDNLLRLILFNIHDLIITE